VRRSEAGRAIRDSALTPSEKLILLALLDRADNEDSKIPHWRSPSLPALERDTSLGHATVLRLLPHLEQHRWLLREGQRRGQLKGTKGAGRGRSATVWRLLPGDVPEECDCPKAEKKPRRPKPDRSVTDQSAAENGPQWTRLDWSTDIGVYAGQGTGDTKGVRDRGEGEWGWPEGSEGEGANIA
jgi:hypothetical protein